MKLYRVSTDSFVAGFEYDSGKVIRAAPILWFMKDWNLDRIVRYCVSKGWRLEFLESASQELLKA